MKIYKLHTYSLLVSICLNICCSESEVIISSYVIKNVNLISMETDEMLSNQFIVIEGSKIVQIGYEDEITAPNNAVSIEGNGQYALPGLIDMHMHIDHPDVLKLNLAYGVTSVMNYRGLPEHLKLRALSKTNEIFSPNIYTTGDYMEGYPATFPGFLSFDDPEEVRKSIIDQKQIGFDFIKIYRNLDTLLHMVICEEAKKNDLTVVGHLSPTISLEQSLRAGQKVIAHAEELMYFFNNENDTTQISELVDLLKQYQVTFTPNLSIFHSLFLQVRNIDSINSLEHLKYLQPALRQSWRKEYNYNHPRGNDWADFMEDRFAFLKQVTKHIKQADIPILASTDSPTAGAFPGLAVHQELQEFVKIGFTPYEALKTATVEPGKFLKQHVANSDDFGMIKEGFEADILLLQRNPLDNIENTQSISGVIKNGSWYARDSLNNIFNELRVLYDRIDPVVRDIELHLNKEELDKAYDIYDKAKRMDSTQLFLGHYTMAYAGYRFLYENRKLTENPERAENAIQHYSMYLRDYPQMHSAYYFLGIAYRAKKDTVAALTNFKKSLELHPYNPYVKKQLAELSKTD